ncbi:MAG TPA: hypothetical protein DCL35_04865 [Candidatus Omnitrophica bacterium]|nr:hypothetical protein [Candidatus Omnitrophota bacterium]
MPVEQKKLFIFDLDGTLVDAYPAIIRSFNFTMKKMGYPVVSRDEIIRAVGWGDTDLIRPFVRRQDLARALRVYRKHHAESLRKNIRLMPHAKSLLLCLKSQGIKTAIATNRPSRFTRIILRRLKIDVLFDKVLCADKLDFAKPHPLILNTLLKMFHLARVHAVYVGDMALDVETGRRAGIDTIAVATGSSRLQELKKAKPARLFKDLKQLMGYCG